MFLGSFEVSMDAKGRFTLPGTLREQLAGDNASLMMTSDPMQDCLLIYTGTQWSDVIDNYLARPNTDEVVKAFGQILMGNAQQVDVDGSGRMVVPPYLRKTGQMQKKLIIRGMGNKIEVWSQQAHEQAEQSRQALLRNPASRVSLEGISY